MARTTPSKVRGIIETDDELIPDLTPYIETANELVTECCTASGYTDTRLELIERWLSAHFYAVRDPRATLEQVSPGVMAQYESKVDLQLNLTRYGQQVLIIDTKGNLAAIPAALATKRQKNIRWLGTEDC